MNRLDMLLMQFKQGRIVHPDLRICLSYIHQLRIGTPHETKPLPDQGSAPVSGESSSDQSLGPKAKRVRERTQGGTDGASS